MLLKEEYNPAAYEKLNKISKDFQVNSKWVDN